MKNSNLNALGVSDKFQDLTDKDMKTVVGGIGPALIVAIFALGYTMGKDIANRK
ncbi:hypothetical protein LACPH_002226 [Lacticaseibacillus parahuelsenbergensis]|uniref:Class IIb bacteriocin, lactobin A/cerein 7B family n=1 Tax=Lacticaseibacillus parahuelsenbergensis TaxID=3068305 RepID=A0ABY9L1T6_9LACO|nr:hypothetical protein [Lacticaseibacillus sp. NCIMB 15471]WLV77478.1 hypothetical protein LACPH_002226 [Lacticaseibacillus sp. NCIMB 15471]